MQTLVSLESWFCWLNILWCEKPLLKIDHVFIVHDVVVEMESFWEKKTIIKIQTKGIRKECTSILNFVFNIRFTMIYWKKNVEKSCLNACQKYKYWNMNVIILKYECDK